MLEFFPNINLIYGTIKFCLILSPDSSSIPRKKMARKYIPVLIDVSGVSDWGLWREEIKRVQPNSFLL